MTTKRCLHCQQEYAVPVQSTVQVPLIAGHCPACSARHEEIATVAFAVSVADARKILGGMLPGRVRAILQELVRMYDEG